MKNETRNTEKKKTEQKNETNLSKVQRCNDETTLKSQNNEQTRNIEHVSGLEKGTRIRRKTNKNMEINIGTLNTRTLRTEEKLQELEYALEDITWDIIGLSEIRRNADVLMERKNGYVLLHSSAERSMFGTGFIVKNKFRNNIVDFMPISKRIAVLKMKFKKTNLIVIQLHAPTSEHKKKRRN